MRRLRPKHILLLWPAVLVAACTLDPLNPQPLPPDPPPEFQPTGADSGSFRGDAAELPQDGYPDGGTNATADAGGKGDAAPAPPADDGGDGGDAGDGGDGGDATTN